MKRGFLLSLLCVVFASLGFARDLTRGYRGFVEWDNAIGHTDYRKKSAGDYGEGTLWFIGISSSHGYQFNKHWFLGGGAMVSCGFPKNDKVIPGFAEVRYDTKCRSMNPFIDFRIGYYFDGLSEGGLYLSPTLGHSFRTSKNLNINFGLGMTLRSFTKHIYSHTGSQIGYIRTDINYFTFFSCRLGIEFQ